MNNLLKILAIALCIPAIIQARFWMCPGDAQKYATRAEAQAACGDKAYYHFSEEAQAAAERIGERARGFFGQAPAPTPEPPVAPPAVPTPPVAPTSAQNMGGGAYDDDMAEIGTDMDDTY